MVSMAESEFSVSSLQSCGWQPYSTVSLSYKLTRWLRVVVTHWWIRRTFVRRFVGSNPVLVAT